MNYRSDVPGYGYQLEKGATSLTESWKAEGASHNHMMLGHLVEWFYGGLGGIKQTENSVAFKSIVIEPEVVGDVTSCQTLYNSPYGMITCDWKLGGENYFEMTIDIPCNTTAAVYLPIGDKKTISLNKRSLDINDLTVSQRSGKKKAMVNVGSGTHRFVVSD
jgi:alpha-L-rhamnosidase